MNSPIPDGDDIVWISSFKKLGKMSKIHNRLNSKELHSSVYEKEKKRKKDSNVKHFAELFTLLYILINSLIYFQKKFWGVGVGGKWERVFEETA